MHQSDPGCFPWRRCQFVNIFHQNEKNNLKLKRDDTAGGFLQRKKRRRIQKFYGKQSYISHFRKKSGILCIAYSIHVIITLPSVMYHDL